MTRLLFGLLWLGLVAYAFVLAPPDDPATLELIVKLSTGQWSELNPLIVALFNLMGLWPLAYMVMLLPDGHRRSGIPAWPFVVGGFGLGAFAILPYLALRGPERETDKPEQEVPTATPGQPKLLQGLTSRGWGLFLGTMAVVLLAYGLGWGDWGDFWRQWHSSRFIHVMSLDFCILTLLFPVLILGELQRYDPWEHPNTDGKYLTQFSPLIIAWVTILLPGLGAMLYLLGRPRQAFLPISNAVVKD